MKKKNYVQVPEYWLKGLLDRADDFSNKIATMEYHNEWQWATDKDELFRKASALLGYAVDGERFIESKTDTVPAPGESKPKT